MVDYVNSDICNDNNNYFIFVIAQLSRNTERIYEYEKHPCCGRNEKSVHVKEYLRASQRSKNVEITSYMNVE